jgi:hypothetical protein
VLKTRVLKLLVLRPVCGIVAQVDNYEGRNVVYLFVATVLLRACNGLYCNCGILPYVLIHGQEYDVTTSASKSWSRSSGHHRVVHANSNNDSDTDNDDDTANGAIYDFDEYDSSDVALLTSSGGRSSDGRSSATADVLGAEGENGGDVAYSSSAPPAGQSDGAMALDFAADPTDPRPGEIAASSAIIAEL